MPGLRRDITVVKTTAEHISKATIVVPVPSNVSAIELNVLSVLLSRTLLSRTTPLPIATPLSRAAHPPPANTDVRVMQAPTSQSQNAAVAARGNAIVLEPIC